MDFEITIGLEIHVEMKTKSKMFSSSPVDFLAEPNTLTTPYDLAFPGVLPVPNKQAVINAIQECYPLLDSLNKDKIAQDIKKIRNSTKEEIVELFTSFNIQKYLDVIK